MVKTPDGLELGFKQMRGTQLKFKNADQANEHKLEINHPPFSNWILTCSGPLLYPKTHIQ